MSLSRHNWILIAILGIAAVLRLWHLNDSLWYDEILTLTQSVRLPAGKLLTTFGSLNNHILYTWLAKLCIGMFGEHAWSLRLPAAIFGVASIWATWRLMQDLGYKTEALIVAALLAVSYHHVWFSQNARGYTLMLFLLMYGSVQLERALRTRRLATWASYGLLAALALFTHLSAVFVLIGQGIMILVLQWKGGDRADQRRDLLGPIVAVAVCAVLCLIAFAPLIPGIVSALGNVATPEAAQGAQEVDIKKWRNPLWTLAETLASFGFLGAVLPIAGALICWGGLHLSRKSPAAIGGVFLSIPICVIALVLGHMRIWPRYFFVDIGVLLGALVIGSLLFAGFAVIKVNQFLSARGKPRLAEERTGRWLKVAGISAMALASIGLLRANYVAPKQDFTGAYDFVQSQLSQDDVAVTVGLARIAYYDYLDKRWAPVETVDALRTAAPLQSSRTFVVIAFPDHMRKHYPAIAEELDTSYEKVRRFKGTLSEGDIIVYASKTTRAAP